MSEENCYTHKKYLAVDNCERCGLPICEKCTNSYWHTNIISRMFQAQKQKEEEMTFCNRCLKNARIRNGIISGFLLVLFLGSIVFFIVIGVV